MRRNRTLCVESLESRATPSGVVLSGAVPLSPGVISGVSDPNEFRGTRSGVVFSGAVSLSPGVIRGVEDPNQTQALASNGNWATIPINATGQISLTQGA
jgi:hypothetical protein